MKNILVTGANGQLGSELKVLSDNNPNYFFTDIQELDILDKEQVVKYIKDNKIGVIVNCAAYTNVDKAESEVELSDSINTQGPANLAEISKENNLILIHISTDYVFNGNKKTPYHESEKCTPQTSYGRGKRAGEIAVKKSGCQGIIIRTAWLYSSFGSNFVKTMINLGSEKESIGVVADQYGSPTYARDLAEAIIQIIPQLDTVTRYGEVFHYTNEGSCSWFDFASKIMQLYRLNCQVNPITTEEYPTAAERPAYSVLDKSLIKAAFGIEILSWEKSLSKAIKRLRVL